MWHIAQLVKSGRRPPPFLYARERVYCYTYLLNNMYGPAQVYNYLVGAGSYAVRSDSNPEYIRRSAALQSFSFPETARAPSPFEEVDRGAYIEMRAKRPTKKRKAYQYATGARKRSKLGVPVKQVGLLRTSGYFGGSEVHFRQYISNDTTTAVTAKLYDDILAIAQDNKVTGRNGTAVRLHTLSLNFQVTLNAIVSTDFALTQGHGHWRFVLVQDRQCNGAAAAFVDIFESIGLQTYRNRENLKRFRILYDKTLVLNSAVTAHLSDGTTTAVVNYFQPSREAVWKVVFPLKSMEIDYKAGTTDGAVSTRKSNNVFLYVYTGHAGSATVYCDYELLFTG